jgi:hypothetical protein
MLKFPPIDPDAVRVLVFDCTLALESTEVLQGGAVLRSVVCTAGSPIDVNPQQIILGPLSYDSTGRMILVPVGNLATRNGNDYEFEVMSATNQPPKEVVGRALLEVRIT